MHSSRLPAPESRGPLGGAGSGVSKEQEVDALTQMLMMGLEGTKDPDFYGNAQFLKTLISSPFRTHLLFM